MQSSISTNEDPPFNFQSMLRKTKYQRNSMKRSNDFRMSLPHEDELNNNNNSGMIEMLNWIIFKKILLNYSQHFPVVFNSRSKSTSDVSGKTSKSKSPSGGKKTPDRNENIVFLAPGKFHIRKYHENENLKFIESIFSYRNQCRVRRMQ